VSVVRALVFTILCLVLALVVVGGLGELGLGSFVLLLGLAALGLAVWWQRNRSRS
jgi:hypothetical protein